MPDLSTVLCPPYDVISVKERERLLDLDAANAVRVELPAKTTASATDDDYRRAAATLSEWLAAGTLRRDDVPLVYVYEQRVDDGGGERVARSFFCRLRLEDYGPSSGVLPHERTLSGPREHRFRLLSAVRTHLSPVLLLYDDGDSGAASGGLLDELTSAPPDVSATGPARVTQRLWAVDPSSSEAARRLLDLAAAGPLTIADGHHRYETALRYRDLPGSPADAQFVLALLYDARSGGLALAPWHRMISGVDEPGAVLKAADGLFRSRRCKSPSELLAALSSDSARDGGVIGMWTRDGGSVLTIDPLLAERWVRDLPTPEVRRLDVSVLSGTLRRMIGSSEQELTASGRLTYTHDAHEAVELITWRGADVCFLLRPTPVDQVLAVAAAGDYMPPKSTYFYPKAATGLVFDPLF